MIKQAIEEGVRRGFEQVLSENCDGRNDPEDRCPMRPEDGCACYYRAYQSAPWWRRWRMEKPIRPTQDHVFKTLLRWRIRDLVVSHPDPGAMRSEELAPASPSHPSREQKGFAQ